MHIRNKRGLTTREANHNGHLVTHIQQCTVLKSYITFWPNELRRKALTNRRTNGRMLLNILSPCYAVANYLWPLRRMKLLRHLRDDIKSSGKFAIFSYLKIEGGGGLRLIAEKWQLKIKTIYYIDVKMTQNDL